MGIPQPTPRFNYFMKDPQLRGGAVIVPHATWMQRILWAPRLWLRLQLNYLSGFPCIMGIALLYAHYIGFEAFNPS